ncbi:MAG: molybdenum cofactor guanylyltransferase MobA [Hyphomicrobium sp.]
MTSVTDILGVILAGGRASRMGGGDKGLVDLAGRPMLAHVIDRFAPQVAQVILNANGDPARFTSFGLQVVADDESRSPQGMGPLAGLLAGLAWAEQSGAGYHWVATVTTDTPMLPPDLVERLAGAANRGPAIAASGGRRHPTIGLWPLAIAKRVRAALDEGRLGADAFAKANAAVEVAFPFLQIDGHEVDPFFNANAPDDIATARRLLSGST